MGLPDVAVERAARNAFVRGTKRTDHRGPLRKYLDRLLQKGQDQNAATDIIVYGDNIYLFASAILVTTWPVPEAFKPTGMWPDWGDSPNGYDGPGAAE